MRWSKLKKLIEDNFSDEMKGRITINSTRYGACTCGHAWISLDKEIIANFCTRAYYNRYTYGDKNKDKGLTEDQIKRYKDQFVEYGEKGRQDIYELCWSYVHDLNFNDALKSDDPLIQCLVVLDKRLGKRRIDTLKNLHPLANHLLAVRKEIMT